MKILLTVCVCSIIYCFGVGKLTRNYSQMDKLWSLLLVLLFMGSSALGEKITSGKYPRYDDYIRQVRKSLPTGKFDAGE